jgi:hypothetical protein
LISAAAALVYESRRDMLAALLVTSMLALSALTTLGALYQLIGQVLGLTLLLAMLGIISRCFKEELSGRLLMRYALLIGIVGSALVIAYPELLPFLGLGSAIHVSVMVVRRRRLYPLKQFAATLGVAAVIAVVFLNVYVVDALAFLKLQATLGTIGGKTGIGLFPSYMVPSGLSIVWGFTPLPALGTESSWAILAGGVLLLIAIAGAVMLVWQEKVAAAVLLVMALLTLRLFVGSSAFGLFKMAMFVQPFLIISVVMLWLHLMRGRPLVSKVLPLLLLSMAGMSAQQTYVRASYGTSRSFVEIYDGSRVAIANRIQALLAAENPQALVLDTQNLVLQRILVAYTRGIPTALLASPSSLNLYYPPETYGIQTVYADDAKKLVTDALALVPYVEFKIPSSSEPAKVNKFSQNNIGRVFPVGSPNALWVFVDPEHSLVNRRALAKYGNAPMVGVKGDEIKNHLVPINSTLGSFYYDFVDFDERSLFQTEPDYFSSRTRIYGLGRYLLFETVNPSSVVRVEMEITASLKGDKGNKLPALTAIGDDRVAFPVLGRGSARVFSEPVKPQKIGDYYYVMFDMGESGKYPEQPPRSGLARAWGRDIRVDNRRLVVFGRGVSLVSDDEYASLDAPAKVQDFPDDILLNPDLEYSGLYEDGWMSEAAFLGLKSLPEQKRLVVEGSVPDIGNGAFTTRAEVMIDGVTVQTQDLPLGSFTISVPYSGPAGRHRIDLRFSNTQNLPGLDGRPVAGRASYIGFD